MSDLWRSNQVDVRLSLAALDRLLRRATGRRSRPTGLVPDSGAARILLWSSPRPPAEPAVVGMVVVRPGVSEADVPTIRELHWLRTSNERALCRRIERLAGQALDLPRAVNGRLAKSGAEVAP
jgi:hypothetical protein